MPISKHFIRGILKKMLVNNGYYSRFVGFAACCGVGVRDYSGRRLLLVPNGYYVIENRKTRFCQGMIQRREDGKTGYEKEKNPKQL